MRYAIYTDDLVYVDGYRFKSYAIIALGYYKQGFVIDTTTGEIVASYR